MTKKFNLTPLRKRLKKPTPKKALTAALLLVLLYILTYIGQYFIPFAWDARLIVTHPLHQAVRVNNKPITIALSQVPYYRSKILTSPIKHSCMGTPAELALKGGKEDLFKILIKKQSPFEGCVPLIIEAIRQNNYAAFKLLVNQGADINQRYHGASFLDYAVSRSCDETSPTSQIAEFLVQAGLNVNDRAFYPGEKNFERRTPLYSALSYGCLSNAQLLIESGANKNMNVYGKPISAHKNFDFLLTKIDGNDE